MVWYEYQMKKITSMCTKALAVSCCQQAQALSSGSELCHLQQQAQAVILGSELCYVHEFCSSFRLQVIPLFIC